MISYHQEIRWNPLSLSVKMIYLHIGSRSERRVGRFPIVGYSCSKY